MDLTTKTPVEIDTALAEIYGRYYAVQDKIDQHAAWIKDYRKGLEKKAEIIAKGNQFGGAYSGWTEERLNDLVAKREALQAQAVEILEEALPYNAEYRRRPWSRFHLVQNNGGHIHSSMHCSTCYPTTRFGWLPNLSGQTEAEAVAAHGAILCTVCYPSAPTEWTDRHDDSACPGSGRYYDSNLPHRKGYAYGNWATCAECHTTQTLTKGMKIKKHKKA